MERNYFIKKNYKANLVTHTVDTENQIYWSKSRILHSYYNRYNLYNFCKKLVKKKDLKNVLDVGCGPALKLMKLIYPNCHEVYGIDQESIIEFCKKKHGLKTFFSDDIENPSLNLDKKFALILSFDVIEHLLKPNKLISYIKKYCHENTYIIITTPERDILRGKNCNYSPKNVHVREWNSFEFNKYLKNQGFKILAHVNGEGFSVYLNFKKSLSEIKVELMTQLDLVKRYNSLNKIRHCQMVLCKLKNSSEDSNEKSLIQLFNRLGTPNLNDIFKIVLIKIYNFFYYYYQFFYKIYLNRIRLK